MMFMKTYTKMIYNSGYSKESKFYFGENKKVIGKFKDEAAGHPITEFSVGLKSKMYSNTTEIKTDSDSESESDTESSAHVTGSEIKTEIENHKTAKGFKKNVIERDLQHSDYLSCLQNNMIRHKMKGIRSEYHQVQVTNSIKLAYRVMMINVIFITMELLVMLMDIIK